MRTANFIPPWKDAGVVDRGGLENRCALAGTQGSNPCLSATLADYQPLANEWGKKWGKIKGNAQFWAFLFVFMEKKTGTFHNAPAILINQMRKESIQGYCWCFIFLISQTTAHGNKPV